MLTYPIQNITATLADNRDTQKGHSLLNSSVIP